MSWTVLDILALAIVLSGAVFGALRGIRGALYLLVCILASIVAILGLTTPLETVVLRLANMDASAYVGAPAVAVLLLEGKTTAAYFAALVPLGLSVFVCLFFLVGAILLRKFLGPPWRVAVSRLFGMLIATVAGGLAVLLLFAQLTRLPWPPASSSLNASILMSRINALFPGLFSILAGAV